MIPLKNNFQGKKGERIPHNWLNIIANFWNDFQVVGGTLDRRSDGRFTKITIPVRPGAVRMPFVNIFEQTSATGGTWTTGKVFLAGVDTLIVGVPTTITGVTTSTLYWIKHDFAAAGVAWQSGAAYPAPSDTYEIYRMLEITFADGAITSFICPNPCDIHATAKST